MVKKQFSLRRGRQSEGLAGELSILSEEMRAAFFAAEEAYRKLGIRYAVVGGLAVGAHGEPRATRDIDFLVGDEAFTTGPIVSFAVPLPLQAFGVSIDAVPLPVHVGRAAVLDRALSHPHIDRTTGVDVPILAALELAYMKLAAGRSKDLGDVISMLRRGSLDPSELVALAHGDDELLARLVPVLEEVEREDNEE